MMFRRLDDSISVAPQIDVADVGEVAAQGFSTIINNRPDGEEPGQPSGAEIAAAAEAMGLSYNTVPITHSGFSREQIAAMRAALDGAPGPVLAYCRSGTRSTLVWALARYEAGDDPAELQAKARGAEYDLSPIAELMRR